MTRLVTIDIRYKDICALPFTPETFEARPRVEEANKKSGSQTELKEQEPKPIKPPSLIDYLKITREIVGG